MNLRSELLEVFGPEVGHALTISSWERLEEWVKRKLAEVQAATVELVIAHLEKVKKLLSCGPEWQLIESLEAGIRAVSPDPHAKERWELQARLETLRDWPELCNGDEQVPVRHAKLCKYHREIADLERQLAALPKEGE